jgi:hypothetical protein
MIYAVLVIVGVITGVTAGLFGYVGLLILVVITMLL